MNDNNIKAFGKKVQILSQSGSKELMLTAKEAKDLYHELFALVLELNSLKNTLARQQPANDIHLNVDAGKFK